jgi:hypothetical protein
MLHVIASLCILTHSFKLHFGMMHFIAFISIFNVALQCIWYKVHSCAFSCILCRMAGTRIQPTDDTVDQEEGDGEESDEDLDGM